MLNPKNIKVTPTLLRIFWSIIIIFYVAFLIFANGIIAIFGILYSIEFAAMLIFIEIIVNLLFIGYFIKNRKSVKKQFHLMLFLALFASAFFVMLALLTKIFLTV